MSTRSLAAAAVSAALLAGALHAAPSVEITNVQQQYPWTNTVDITYTVQGVNKTHQTNRLDHIVNDTYFATFEAKDSSGNPIRDTAGNTVFTNGLVNGNGTFTTQWQPANNLQLVANTATPSVFRGEENAYLVVNLETNKQGKCEYWYEPMSTQEDSNKRYNTDLYKTKYMVFRKVYPGNYQIGEVVASGSARCGDFYNTRHTVTVPSGTCYYIGVFPVTHAQYTRIIGATAGTSTKSYFGTSYNTLRGNTLPQSDIEGDAENTSSFLVRLSGLCGLTIDLPTIEMFEIACRAGTTSIYYWGDSANDNYVWHTVANNAHSVGEKLPNNWGLYDMRKNIWQYGRDVYTAEDLAKKTTSIYEPRVTSADGTVLNRNMCVLLSSAADKDWNWARSSYCGYRNTTSGDMKRDGFRASIVFK